MSLQKGWLVGTFDKMPGAPEKGESGKYGSWSAEAEVKKFASGEQH